ncbi:phage tail sheath family protein [Arthrobacter humicola]
MAEYLAPGVIVQEVDSGPTPIVGVGTSTTGFVGLTRRGPAVGRPLLVTDYGTFVRTFGGALPANPLLKGFSDLPDGVRGFFANGGRRLYIARVLPAGATMATTTTTGGATTTTRSAVLRTATSVQLTGLLRGIEVGTSLQLRTERDGIEVRSAIVTVAAINAADRSVTVGAAFSATRDFPAGSGVLTGSTGIAANGSVTGTAAPKVSAVDSVKLAAHDPGSWGRDLQVVAQQESAARTEFVAMVSAAAGDTKIRVLNAAAFYPKAWVEIDTGAAKYYRQCLSVAGSVLTLNGPKPTLTLFDPAAPAVPTRVSSCEFGLTVSYPDAAAKITVTEQFSGMTIDQVPNRYFRDVLAGSSLILVGDGTGVVPADPVKSDPFSFPVGTFGGAIFLSGNGADATSAPVAANFVGTDGGPNQRTGLLSMEEVDEVAILAAPGVSDPGVQLALIEQCELLMDRFAVLDPVSGAAGQPASLGQIVDQRNLFDTKYAALYYPRVLVVDDNTGVNRPIGPSGHVCGVYARTDSVRGVHKAPANEVIGGIMGFEAVISRGQHEVLNPVNINVLRDLRSQRRGLRVYGARCLTSQPAWNYVNVRRLFIFLEESLDEGTQSYVFEPNDERLWARIRDSVTIFLTRVWRDGALMGSSPEEAFFVRCDRSTMGDDDILNGRLIMDIGVAPVRPAEFVVLRIGQWIGGSSVQEL